MEQPINLKEIADSIKVIRETAEELNRAGESFPALSRNTARILASTKMLEINISDAVDLV